MIAARSSFLAAVFFPAGIFAAEIQWGGHLKVQGTGTEYRSDDVGALRGARRATDGFDEIRLRTDARDGPWDGSFHYEELTNAGDSLESARILGLGNGLPSDHTRLMDLTDTIADERTIAAVHRVDRLSAAYGEGPFFVRAGRQAITWGNGIVFHPLDLFNPFPPLAVDTEYKTGDDMLLARIDSKFGQSQILTVPRRDPATRTLAADQSSLAAKQHLRTGSWDFELLAARHFGESLGGFGIVRSIGGAVWRFDGSYTSLSGGGGTVSMVTNADYSWVFLKKNLYGFLEYFHNGFGTTQSNYGNPPGELASRIFRGELFVRARDYTATGVQIEWTPILNSFVYWIENTNDGSALIQLRGVYDCRQNIQMIGGLQVPSGRRGTEFGGFAVGPGVYAAPGTSLFVRTAFYLGGRKER